MTRIARIQNLKFKNPRLSAKSAVKFDYGRNYFSPAGRLCHSEVMTPTEKLLAELIALPSVNPAFGLQGDASARLARLSKFGEKNVADFLARWPLIDFQQANFSSSIRSI